MTPESSSVKKLQEENEKLKATLSFYADINNWIQIVDGKYNLGKIWVYADYENRFMNPSITTENGERARKVLGEIDE